MRANPKILASAHGAIVENSRPQILGWVRGDALQSMVSVASHAIGPMLRPREANQQLHVLTTASRRVRWFSIILSLLSFTAVAALWAVVVCLLWIVSLVCVWIRGDLPWPVEAASQAFAFKYVLQTIIFIVPNITVMFLHYWAYEDQDRVFVAALQQKGLSQSSSDQEHLQQLANALEVLPEESTWLWLRKYVAKVLRGGYLSLGLLAISAVPWVGRFIYPVALFLKRGKHLGHVPIALLMLISLLPSGLGLPSGSLLATWGLQFLLTARSTAKELLYTLMSRASKEQKSALHSQHHARITGFGAAAACILSIPVIGPLFWFDLVWLASELLGSIALSEPRSLFNLEPAVTAFNLEQESRRQEAEQRALEREARSCGKRVSSRSLT